MNMNFIEKSIKDTSSKAEQKNYSVEVLQRFSSKIEEKHINSILECLERTLKDAELIGEGKNAKVFQLQKPWEQICVKVFKKDREVINDFEQEYEFQQMVNDLGITTPENLLAIEDKSTKQEYLLMERINGYSLKDILEGKNAKAKKVYIANLENFPHESYKNYTLNAYLDDLEKYTGLS